MFQIIYLLPSIQLALPAAPGFKGIGDFSYVLEYEASSYLSHEPTQPRKLLLHRKQIDTLTSEVLEKRLTLVPLKLYIKGNIAKVEVALAKGKKLYDKRESIIRREAEREIGRAVKRQKLQGR